MASPEASAASSIAPSGTTFPEAVFEDLSSTLLGWKKKFSKKIGGSTPKGKGVSYVTPDGEEIRSKRQMKKYLKGHPAGPTAADFDWTSGESPRRSLRLSSKERLSSDSLEAKAELPVTKRLKRVVFDTAKDTVSLVVAATGRKGRAKETVAASVAGNEEDMQDVKKDTQQAKEFQATEENADVEKVNGQQLEASVSMENKIVNNTEGEKGASAAADEPVLMDVDVLSSAVTGDVLHADKNLVNKGAVKTVESEIHVSPTVATTVATGEDPTSKHEEKQHAALASEVRLESDVGTFTIQNGKKAEVDGEGTYVPVSSVVEQTATEQMSEVNVVEEILNQQITNFLTDEHPEEDKKANGVDINDLVSDNRQEVKSKAVELPQPQGIHALVDASVTFAPGAEPQEEEAPHTLSDLLQPVGIIST
ncbi:unnamed protein product [Sphagnum troendelagicum]|uniref:MBD domain-containing protein n=1 Tax=Sphagnum troendelagicum TaxID=128251 RepID=A0ABP0TLE3_9BRYO